MAGDDKTRGLQEIDRILKSIQATYEKVAKASSTVAGQIKATASGAASAGGGSGTVSGNNGGTGDFHEPPKPSNWVGSALATGFSAAAQMVDPSQYVENQMARNRFGYLAGFHNTPGGSSGAGYGVFQSMMRNGLAINPMDAARAAMSGASMGFMPGLSNYNTVAQSAATVSNLAPGAGLQAGMQASAALNQGQSINRLRMIGINVRDASGNFMGVGPVVEQLWGLLKSQAIGTGKITAQDIAFSLQPGNSLDMLLNQYFSGDPVLRQAVISGLIQKAQGGTLSQKSLLSTGAIPKVAQSFGQRNAAAYRAINAYTSQGVQGVMDANSQIAFAANMFADSVKAFGGIVQGMSWMDTMSGAGNGAGGVIGSSIAKALQPIFSILTTALSVRLGMGGAAAAAGATGAEGAAVAAGAGILPAAGFLGVGALGIEAGARATGAVTDARLSKMFTAHGVSYSAFKEGYLKQGGDLRYFDRVAASAGMSSTGSMSWSALQKQYPSVGDGPALSGIGDGGNLDLTSYTDGVKSAAGIPMSMDPLAPNRLTIPVDGEYNNYSKFRQDHGLGHHHGVDFMANMRTPVKAIKDGKVYFRGKDGSLGNALKIAHADGYKTYYGHLDSYAVANKTSVKAGDIIGYSGNSGTSSGPHLHIGLEGPNGLQDPVPYMKGAAGGVTNLGNNMSTVGAATSSSTASSGPSSSGISLFSQSSGSLFSSGIGDGPAATGGGSGYVNYGGVTVNIHVPANAAVNEQVLAKEIKRVLHDEQQMSMAVSR